MAADSPLTVFDDDDDDDDFNDDQEEAPSQSPQEVCELFVINTNYDPGHEENLVADFSKRGDEDFRFNCTERERLLADIAEEPKSLDNLSKTVSCPLLNCRRL